MRCNGSCSGRRLDATHTRMTVGIHIVFLEKLPTILFSLFSRTTKNGYLFRTYLICNIFYYLDILEMAKLITTIRVSCIRLDCPRFLRYVAFKKSSNMDQSKWYIISSSQYGDFLWMAHLLYVGSSPTAIVQIVSVYSVRYFTCMMFFIKYISDYNLFSPFVTLCHHLPSFFPTSCVGISFQSN